MGGDDMATVNTGGRRWVPVYWLAHAEVADGLDRLVHLHTSATTASLVERDYEYRLCWDPERSLWRLDRRRFVAGH